MIHFKVLIRLTVALLLATLIPTGSAQTVSIPDPGLDAAVRDALQKPTGPLTQQDLLKLTVLNAHERNISSLAGLEAASNLSTLLLFGNHLTSFSQPTLTKLAFLDLSRNSLTNLTLPPGLSNLFSLVLEQNRLTQLVLPADLGGLEELDLNDNLLVSLDLPPTLTGLGTLDLGFNALTQFSLPAGLANLDLLRLSGNLLTNFTVPTGLTRLTQLYLDQNQLTTFTLPPGVTNLHALDLFFNELIELHLPPDQQQLISLDLDNNRLTALDLPPNLTGLGQLHLRANQLTSFDLPGDLKALSFLDLGENRLRSANLPAGLGRLNYLRISGNTNLGRLTLPPGMTNLAAIFLRFNGLTNLTLPPDLNQLIQLDTLGNQLGNIELPRGLTSLTNLILSGNQLTNLTLPPDLTRLALLFINGNPLTQLVLSEPEALRLPETVAALQQAGIPVFTYPLTIQLKKQQLFPNGAFRFAITGPPGNYTVLSSTNLTDWTELGHSTNSLGSIFITDTFAQFSPTKYYRVQPQTVPEDLVLIAPNTFMMGSPNAEVGHQADEGPQTTVTLSHGFWMGKFPVTQREYLAVTGENPSGFPGDLSRPVESVSFFAASNYCAQLTLQDLAAARIPSGTHYRLPTEAEWECAARAGTSTRFYYGDDPTLSELSKYAWFGAHDGITTHPVGLKLPNAWGLYDMEGNVWEWCQDWYGTYPGGAVTDPQGPATNAVGNKVIRGGAWEASEFDCRSASRSIEGASPFISDFIIGFRVVLVPDR
ncbi:MAG TPA: SUMF1/EgtB/PvdO family nonheme iron enzyme [Candidatus Limnocylindria bacterium]|jgi:formylglycine-generating enzyme required for sulfatase activity|nr:SUMF1/EgtB/PvdO family nonheme iron enzyme [Candidatus Limnocylindria bacterium]